MINPSFRQTVIALGLFHIVVNGCFVIYDLIVGPEIATAMSAFGTLCGALILHRGLTAPK